jgi:hypothetical protein
MTTWTIADVAEEPEVTLTDWQIRELPNEDRHLVGFVLESRKGRASSLVAVFDPASMRAVTGSGRAYQLYGRPGLDCYGEHVWGNWARLYGVTDFSDVSANVRASHAADEAGTP